MVFNKIQPLWKRVHFPGIVPGIVPDDFYIDSFASDKNYIHIYFISCEIDLFTHPYPTHPRDEKQAKQ
jgi:hypothetical protein